MSGTILNAAARRKIANSYIQVAASIQDRKGLVATWEAARITLDSGFLFEKVVKALTDRAIELGVFEEGR